MIIVDLVNDEIVAQVEIPNLKAWQLQEQDGEAVWYRTYRPGLAWDLNQLRIYVAHPDEEWISVVDLATGELVAQQEITRPQSLFDRIFDWLVPTAQAKGNPTTSKTAVLRDDGKRLYITGTHESFTQDADGDITQPDINDLVVVDTERLEEVERMKLGTIRSMLPTLDGQYLIIESYDFDHQLTKFDMTTSEIVAQLELPSESSSRLTIFDQTVLVRIQIGSLLHKAILIDLASFTILEQRDTWTGWVSDYVNIARS